MSGIDIAILTVLGVSAVISFMRGFVREVFSLAGWVLSFWLAYTYAPLLSPGLSETIPNPTVRIIASFALLILCALILLAMVNYLLGALIKASGLSGTDRMIGIVFGVARGGIIVAVLVLLASVTTLPQESWWMESRLVGHFEQVAFWFKAKLPADLAGNF